MQSTLLGLGIAIILALVAALVGPFFVDWNSYRDVFETEASRLVGLPVKVSGHIEARLLPTPSVHLRGIEVGPPGNRELRAQSLGIEFSLGALVRGELRAVVMQLVGPQITLGLDRSGAVDWPRPAGHFDPDAFAIEQLNIEDGRAVLVDARSGARLVLDKFWFNGAVRSLAGPFKGEGAFVMRDELYGYRFSTSRSDENGELKLRLGIDASERPLSIAADGTLTQVRGAPHFEGTLTLARPVGMTLASGRTVVSDPWKASAKVKVGPAAALMEQLLFQHGPDDRALKFTGTAELKFGAHPRLTGVMSARQIDLDRSMGLTDKSRASPVAAVKTFVDLIGRAFKPPLPFQVGIDVESVMLGGASLQTVRGDIGYDGKSWTLDQFELRAPGFSQAHLSGRIDTKARGMVFTGPVEIDTNDPRALIAWLEGRSDVAAGTMRPLRVRGDITLSAQTIAVNRLRAEFDREKLEGRFAYDWPSGDHPARLEAELRAADLDVDGLLAFGGTALSGTTLARPREVKLAIDVGRATIAKMVVERANGRLHLDAKGLQIERLAVADLGGTAFSATGHIDTTGFSPRGTLTLDLDARELSGVTALLAKFAPQAAGPFRRIAERLAPARLHAILNVDRSTAAADDATVARLAANGTLAATRIDLRSEASGDPSAWGKAKLRLEGSLEAADAKALTALFGLGGVLAVGPGPGRLHLTANGALDDVLDVDGRLAADGLAANAGGKLKLSAADGVSGALHLAVTDADARPLRPQTSGQSADALPVSLTSRVDVAGAKFTFDNLVARVAQVPVRGRLMLVAGTPTKIDGQIAAETVDAGAVIAGVIGMPLTRAGEGEGSWSSAPLTAGAFGNLDGRVEFSAARAVVAGALTATKLRGVVQFGRAELAFEKVSGQLGGGRLDGGLVMRTGINGLAARMQIALRQVASAVLLPARASPALAGRVTLQLEAEGAGRSPRALIGSLAGTGTIALDDVQIAGIDPAAFAAVTDAVDHGLAIESAKVRKVVDAAIDKGRLGIKHMESAITLSAGQARLEGASATADGSAITIAGELDLTSGGIDLQAALSGPKGAYASIAGRPDIVVNVKGTPAQPQRSVDVSALVGWLTLRAVDQQARRLEAVEARRRAPVTDRAVRPASPVIRPSPHGVLSESRRPRATATAKAVNARSGLDRLRPESLLRPRPTTAASAPRAASPLPLRIAPNLPPPIEVNPPPGADVTPRRQANPAPAGRSIDELLIRPQH